MRNRAVRRVLAAPVIRDASCTTGSCDFGADQATPTMTFCCGPSGACPQCRFLQADLGSFDANGEGRGVLEVVLELSTATTGLGLSLWYGAYPKRKQLVILDGTEAGPMGPGEGTRVHGKKTRVSRRTRAAQAAPDSARLALVPAL